MIRQQSYFFEAEIWKIIPDFSGSSALWVLELRNVEAKSSSFAVVDTELTKVLWQGTPSIADWWTTAVALSDDLLLLENYGSSAIPVATDLFGISARLGEVVWAMPRHRLVRPLGVKELLVTTSNPDQPHLKRVNTATGLPAPFPVLDTDEQGTERTVQGYPLIYKAGDLYFETIAGFLHKSVNAGDVKIIEYLEIKPYLIISYYLYENGLPVQYLLIAHRFYGVVYHEKLQDNTDGLSTSLIVTDGKMVSAVRNRKELILFAFSEDEDTSKLK